MWKNGTRALVLVLLLALVIAPIAQGLELEELMHRIRIGENSKPLLMLVGQAVRNAHRGFDGAPGNEIGWGVLSKYVNDRVGTGQDRFTKQDLAGMYSCIFADGSFEELGDVEHGQFKKEDEDYLYEYGDGDPWVQVGVNRVLAYDDGSYDVDCSVYTASNAVGEWFNFNAMATVALDEQGFFGMKIRSFRISTMPKPVVLSVEVSSQLEPQGENTYVATNVIDGDHDTCWAFDGGKNPGATIKFEFSGPTEIRGIVMTPGYAQSQETYDNNSRPKVVRLVMSTGEVVEFEIEESYYQGLDVMPFERVEVVKSIELNIAEMYPGLKYQDLCISEISFF